MRCYQWNLLRWKSGAALSRVYNQMNIPGSGKRHFSAHFIIAFIYTERPLNCCCSCLMWCWFSSVFLFKSNDKNSTLIIFHIKIPSQTFFRLHLVSISYSLSHTFFSGVHITSHSPSAQRCVSAIQLFMSLCLPQLRHINIIDFFYILWILDEDEKKKLLWSV